MELKTALNQLANIHAQLSKTQVYQGIRALPVALSGLSALLGALLQQVYFYPQLATDFVLFWVILAVLNLMCMAAFIGYRHYQQGSHWEYHQMHEILMQFIPTLLVGGLITLIFYTQIPTALIYLPGLWSLVFALGIFSCRPYFPYRAYVPANYYLLVGSGLLWFSPHFSQPQAWMMALSFGGGQLLVAFILYWDSQRHEK